MMNPPENKTEEEWARELGEEHSWENKRKENLKSLGLWEKFKDGE